MTKENASGSKTDTKEDIVVTNENYFQLPIICDVDTLRMLIRKDGARVVDVRKTEEYQQEHIPSAVSLPLAQLLENDIPSAILDLLQNLGISDKMPVVIYDNTFGALAARVAWSFQYIGHPNTALLEMTFSQWKSLGLEIETKINSFPMKKHSLTINHSIYADASYVEAAKEQPNKILIDSRERLNFLTEIGRASCRERV
jgi:thiosulfate/3-mercaptopyruvate sulfurtransferase